MKKISALSSSVLEMIQVTITMNWKQYADNFERILGKPRFRSRQEESHRNGKNNQLATFQKRDGYRLKREDAAGNYMADSGEQLRGFDGEKGTSVNLSLLKTELKAAGFFLVGIDAYRKFGANSTKVAFTFSTEKTKELPEMSYNLFSIATSRDFRHVHIWDNGLKSSITINAGCPEQRQHPVMHLKKVEITNLVEVSYECEEKEKSATAA